MRYYFQEAREGFGGGDVLDDAFLAFVDGDAAGTGADIAVIGISHLAGAVYDAAHHAYLQPLQVLGGFLHFFQGLLQVEQGASAAGTGYVFCLGGAQTHGLEYVKFELC